jgi:hypothetical protein
MKAARWISLAFGQAVVPALVLGAPCAVQCPAGQYIKMIRTCADGSCCVQSTRAASSHSLHSLCRQYATLAAHDVQGAGASYCANFDSRGCCQLDVPVGLEECEVCPSGLLASIQ